MDADLFPLAYLTPEVLIPATSILATIAGVVMMLGSKSVRLACRWLGRAVRPFRPKRSVPAPHFSARRAGRSPAPAYQSDLHEPGDAGRDDL